MSPYIIFVIVISLFLFVYYLVLINIDYKISKQKETQSSIETIPMDVLSEDIDNEEEYSRYVSQDDKTGEISFSKSVNNVPQENEGSEEILSQVQQVIIGNSDNALGEDEKTTVLPNETVEKTSSDDISENIDNTENNENIDNIGNIENTQNIEVEAAPIGEEEEFDELSPADVGEKVLESLDIETLSDDSILIEPEQQEGVPSFSEDNLYNYVATEIFGEKDEEIDRNIKRGIDDITSKLSAESNPEPLKGFMSAEELYDAVNNEIDESNIEHRDDYVRL